MEQEVGFVSLLVKGIGHTLGILAIFAVLALLLSYVPSVYFWVFSVT